MGADLSRKSSAVSKPQQRGGHGPKTGRSAMEEEERLGGGGGEYEEEKEKRKKRRRKRR